jgi:hypothetical protein
MSSKSSRACYASRLMPHISSTDTFKSIYFAYFYSLMKCGVIFWLNSPNSKMIFTLQKRTIRLIADVKSRNSCRNLFLKLLILALPCEYIFTLMNLVVNNQELFQKNSAVHSVNTRNRDHLHRPTASFCCFQENAYCAGIKIFNSLSSNLRSLMNKKAWFKMTLKRYLKYSFCSVEEFLTFKNYSYYVQKVFFLFTVCCMDLV